MSRLDHLPGPAIAALGVQLARLQDTIAAIALRAGGQIAPTGKEASALLEAAPSTMAELPAWFAMLGPDQIRAVWVPAIVNAYALQGGQCSTRELAQALTAVREYPRPISWDDVRTAPRTREPGAGNPLANPTTYDRSATTCEFKPPRAPRQRRSPATDAIRARILAALEHTPCVKLSEFVGSNITYYGGRVMQTGELEVFKHETVDRRGWTRHTAFVRRVGSTAVPDTAAPQEAAP